MQVYADNAATTRMHQTAIDTMTYHLNNTFGNPSSLYTIGQQAKEVLETARADMAACFGAQPREIYFTSGGSEADNQAIISAARYGEKKGKKHIITTAFEHHAVLHTLAKLEKEGFEVTYLDVRKGHNVTAQQVKDAIRPDTCLVTTMYANNEIGSVLPIKEFAKIAKAHKITFFTDAVQAIGNVPVNVADLGVDMLSLSGHKIHAPKGIGALYIRNGVKLEKLVSGGGQERAQRGGTTNTPAVVGMAKALSMAVEQMDENNKHIAEVRDHFVERVMNEITDIKFNGDFEHRVPSVANFSFKYVEGEGILMLMDFNGIAVSSGSACSSGSLDPSHVLLAMGVPIEVSHGSIRFSFGKDNTIEEADYTVDKLKETIARLRTMSPLYNDKIGGGSYNV